MQTPVNMSIWVVFSQACTWPRRRISNYKLTVIDVPPHEAALFLMVPAAHYRIWIRETSLSFSPCKTADWHCQRHVRIRVKMAAKSVTRRIVARPIIAIVDNLPSASSGRSVWWMSAMLSGAANTPAYRLANQNKTRHILNILVEGQTGVLATKIICFEACYKLAWIKFSDQKNINLIPIKPLDYGILMSF